LGFLQKLSHYFGEMKDKERGIGDRPTFDLPWPGFDKDVKKAIDNILVSYAGNKKILSKISKTILKAGKKYRSEGYAARGGLHKELFYGKHIGLIDDSSLLNSKGQLQYERDKNGNFVYYYHKREPITGIESYKDVQSIVDQGVRKLIFERYKLIFNKELDKDSKIQKDFFFDSDNQPKLFLPNKHGDPVPIKKVRTKVIMNNAVQVKYNKNTYVNPRNNHHIIIYKTHDGLLKEKVVSFWEVIERKTQNDSIYKLPEDGEIIHMILSENDSVLLDLPENLIISLNSLQNIDNQELSPFLYRVQKIGGNETYMEICFRHHLDSRTDKYAKKDYVYIKGFGDGKTGWYNYNPVKVKQNMIGSIIRVND